MANYQVVIYETIYHTVEVEADNEETAIDEAKAIVTGYIEGTYESESAGLTEEYDVYEEVAVG